MSQSGKIITGGPMPPAGPVYTLTGDVGGPVSPDGAGNIDTLGTAGEGSQVVGTPGSNRTQISLPYQAVSTTQTTDDTPTVIYSFTMAEDSSVGVDLLVSAFDETNSVAYVGTITGGAYDIAGTVTAIDAQAKTLLSPDSTSSVVLNFVAASPDITVVATGIAATTINWAINVRLAVYPLLF